MIFLLHSNSSEVSAFAMFLIPFLCTCWYPHLTCLFCPSPLLFAKQTPSQMSSFSNPSWLLKAVSHSLFCSPTSFCSYLYFSTQHRKAQCMYLLLLLPCEILKSKVCFCFFFLFLNTQHSEQICWHINQAWLTVSFI